MADTVAQHSDSILHNTVYIILHCSITGIRANLAESLFHSYGGLGMGMVVAGFNSVGDSYF